MYALTLAMLIVLIYELVYNAKQQGNPFSFKVWAILTFAYSAHGLQLINLHPPAYSKPNAGTFIECLNQPGCSVSSLHKAHLRHPAGRRTSMCVSSKWLIFARVMLRLLLGANDTANPATITCNIEQTCGFGGFKGGEPDQSFR